MQRILSQITRWIVSMGLVVLASVPILASAAMPSLTKARLLEIHEGLSQFPASELDLDRIQDLTRQFLSNPARASTLSPQEKALVQKSEDALDRYLFLRKGLQACHAAGAQPILDRLVDLKTGSGCSYVPPLQGVRAKVLAFDEPLGMIGKLPKSQFAEIARARQTLQELRDELAARLRASTRFGEWLLKRVASDGKVESPESCPTRADDPLERSHLREICKFWKKKHQIREEMKFNLRSRMKGEFKNASTDLDFLVAVTRFQFEDTNKRIDAINRQIEKDSLKLNQGDQTSRYLFRLGRGPGTPVTAELRSGARKSIQGMIAQSLDFTTYGLGSTDTMSQLNPDPGEVLTAAHRDKAGNLIAYPQFSTLRLPTRSDILRALGEARNLLRERERWLQRMKYYNNSGATLLSETMEMMKYYPSQSARVLMDHPRLLRVACAPLSEIDHEARRREAMTLYPGGISNTVTLGALASGFAVGRAMFLLSLPVSFISGIIDYGHSRMNEANAHAWQQASIFASDTDSPFTVGTYKNYNAASVNAQSLNSSVLLDVAAFPLPSKISAILAAFQLLPSNASSAPIGSALKQRLSDPGSCLKLLKGVSPRVLGAQSYCDLHLFTGTSLIIEPKNGGSKDIPLSMTQSEIGR